jgi:hypothetical protein
MDTAGKRGALEGIGFGLIAGLIMAIAMVIGFAAVGEPPINVFRLISSLVLGQEALTQTSAANAVAIGTITHLVIAAFFGLIYGLLNSSFPSDWQTDWAKQSGLGAGYGAIIYILTFQLIARGRFPWFLDYPQFLIFVIHVLFYGLPLGLMYVAAERRAHHLPMGPTAAGGAV